MSLKRKATEAAPHASFILRREWYSTYILDMEPTWEWRVLKTYKTPAGEKKDQYAIWNLATRSPYTYRTFELGDGYKTGVVNAEIELVQCTGEFADAYPELVSERTEIKENEHAS